MPTLRADSWPNLFVLRWRECGLRPTSGHVAHNLHSTTLSCTGAPRKQPNPCRNMSSQFSASLRARQRHSRTYGASFFGSCKRLCRAVGPKDGEENKPQGQQEPGDYVRGNWGRWHKICLMQFTADGAYYVEALGVRQWSSRLFMCPWCGAHRDGPCTWHDFSLEAPWLATCRDHSRFQRDMAASKACGFQANHAAFAYYARILDASKAKGLSIVHHLLKGFLPSSQGSQQLNLCIAGLSPFGNVLSHHA